MGKTKQEYLHELALVAFRIDDKAKNQEERSERMKRMATLARDGQKGSEEFKKLELEFNHPTVTDYGDEIFILRKIVKQLRKYKI